METTELIKLACNADKRKKIEPYGAIEVMTLKDAQEMYNTHCYFEKEKLQ